MPDAPPHLYQFQISHFSEKVRWALDHKRWPHRRTSLVPGFHDPRARWVSKQGALPILVLDGQAVADSTRIIAELERLRPDPPLYPADPAARARALAIEEHFDEEVADDLRRIFWSTVIADRGFCGRMCTAGAGPVTSFIWRALFPVTRPLFRRDLGLDAEAIARSRSRLDGHFEKLEREIGPSGYIVGDAFSLADLAAASVMTALVRPPGFPYPLPEPHPQPLADLRASLASRPGWRWVVDMYAKHRPASAEVA